MDKIKCRPLDKVKCGLVFPEHGTLWKVVNYSSGDIKFQLYIAHSCLHKHILVTVAATVV